MVTGRRTQRHRFWSGCRPGLKLRSSSELRSWSEVRSWPPLLGLCAALAFLTACADSTAPPDPVVPPADWLDVLEVESAAMVIDRPEGDVLQIGARLINHWGDTMYLRTAQSCLLRMEVYGPGGGLLKTWGDNCWPITTTHEIPPADSLLYAVHLPAASLESGTYTIDVSFHRVTMNDGRGIDIPGFEAEVVVE